MPDTRSQWHPEEFAEGLRAANPDLAHLPSHELVARAFEEMPDAFGLTPDGFIQRRQWPVKEFVGGLREANPEHAHLPARDLIRGFIDENPGSFTLSKGVVSLAQPPATSGDEPSVMAGMAGAVQQGQQQSQQTPGVVPAHERSRPARALPLLTRRILRRLGEHGTGRSGRLHNPRGLRARPRSPSSPAKRRLT